MTSSDATTPKDAKPSGSATSAKATRVKSSKRSFCSKRIWLFSLVCIPIILFHNWNILLNHNLLTVVQESIVAAATTVTAATATIVVTNSSSVMTAANTILNVTHNSANAPAAVSSNTTTVTAKTSTRADPTADNVTVLNTANTNANNAKAAVANTTAATNISIDNTNKATTTSVSTKSASKTTSAVSSSKPHAYIHVGPPKTGSTSLETLLEKLRDLLEQDNYVQLTHDDAPGEFVNKGVSANLAVCLCYYSDRNCHPDLLKTTFPKFLDSVVANNHNLIISSEFFYTERCNFELMSDFFRRFDVTIILVYRHFHTWLRSAHYQDSLKKVKTGVNTQPFVNFASLPNIDTSVEKFRTFQNYANVFGNASIQVMDMDSLFKGEGLVEQFICHRVEPKPIRTCKKIKHLKQMKTANVAIPVDYVRIVVEAANRGLLGAGVRGDITTTDCWAPQVKHWWEHEHNRTLADLPQSCLTNDQFESLKAATMEIHTEMVQNYIQSNVTIPELEADIEKRRSEYCSVDVNAILDMAAWRNMFATLAQSDRSECN